MKRIAFILITALIVGCSGSNVEPDPGPNPPTPEPTPEFQKGSINMQVYIPKSGAKTYAEDASTDENYIHSIWIQLFEGSAPIDTFLLNGTKLTSAMVNDSTVQVNYEVDNITTTGPLDAKVFANFFPFRQDSALASATIIPMPNKSTPTPSSAFLMSGKTILTKDPQGNFTGTAHIQRNVAKVRVNVIKSKNCLPSDLIIDYANIEITYKNVTDRADTFGITRPASTQQFNYPTRSGGVTNVITSSDTTYSVSGTPAWTTNLHPKAPAANTQYTTTTNYGGQIDSVYIIENLAGTNATNATSVEIKIPTISATEGKKEDVYTYTIMTDGKYNVVRNYIYTLNMLIRGQNMQPLITLDILPWDDVDVNGDILGTYLTLDKEELMFDDVTGKAIVNFCSDAQGVYFDYTNMPSEAIGHLTALNIGSFQSKTINGKEVPDYILLDQQHCEWFGFEIDNLDYLAEVSGSICLQAGNINKCVSIVAGKVFDAHFIVGYPIFSNSQFTSAVCTTDDGGTWLEVSKDKLYTTNAAANWTNTTAVPVFLHLDENLTGSTRTGKIELTRNDGKTMSYRVTQLPALYVGRFGGSSPTNTDYNMGLYTEQICEHYEEGVSPMYKTTNTAGGYSDWGGNIYIGPHTMVASSPIDYTNYSSSPLNWQNTLYQAINYCSYKNRSDNKDGMLQDGWVRWYLPAQAQLMAMWVAYNGYWNTPTCQGFNPEFYWSANDNADYAAEAQYMNFAYGNVGHKKKTGESTGSTKHWYVRCVRNSGTVPSMVSANTDGALIDFTIGMPTGSYNSTSKNVAHKETQAANQTVYHKLIVAKEDEGGTTPTLATWANAKTACTNKGSGWRLPTQRELQAIFVLQNEFGANASKLGEAYYWSLTESSEASNNAWLLYGNGHAGEAGNNSHMVKTYKARVRCVKEQ